MSSTTAKVFVDANVLVYLFDRDEPEKREEARRLLEGTGDWLVLSTQVLAEFYAVVTRKIARPLAADTAAAAVRGFGRLEVVGSDAAPVLRGVRVENPFAA